MMNPGLSVTAFIITVLLAGGTWGESLSFSGGGKDIKETTPDINIHDDSFTVYPNPTSGDVKLTAGTVDTEKVRYQLFDMTGMMIHEGDIEGHETIISMNHLAPSLYFLKVRRAGRTVIMFKIIKN